MLPGIPHREIDTVIYLDRCSAIPHRDGNREKDTVIYLDRCCLEFHKER